MALVNPYCEVPELREHLKDDGARLDETLLERAINSASRAIESLCGRKFWQDAAVVAREYRARDPYTLIVHDISTRTGLLVATDTTGDGTFVTSWDFDDFDLEPRNADVVAAGDTGNAYSFTSLTAIDDEAFPLSDRRSTVRVTAKWGWSSVPFEVNEACILLAAALFKRKDAPFGVAGFDQFGAVRIARRDPDVMALLSGLIRYSTPES